MRRPPACAAVTCPVLVDFHGGPEGQATPGFSPGDQLYLKLSPSSYVDRVKGPLLIIQGASDPRVPAGEAIQVFDALTARGVPAELLIFADEGHGAQKRENVVQTIGRQLEFFQKTLKPAAPPPTPTPR